jgi:hypothetical protein
MDQNFSFNKKKKCLQVYIHLAYKLINLRIDQIKIKRVNLKSFIIVLFRERIERMIKKFD